MKILLVGNHPKDGIHSMKLFADLLFSGLRELGHEVRLVKPLPGARFLGVRGKELKKWFSYLDQFVLFPFELRKHEGWADIAHVCDHANAPFIGYLKNTHNIVTCHDVIGIKRARGIYKGVNTRWTGKILQDWVVKNLQRTKRIVCVSQAVKKELIEDLNINENKVSVIYNGLNYPFAPMTDAAANEKLVALGIAHDQSFILHVGSNTWRKNRLGAIKIFNELKRIKPTIATHLIMAGALCNDDEKNYIEQQGLAGRVQALEHADSENLCALYSKAVFFLFPSRHEGFGWPIIEAQACGCPVVTSNREPMTEVSGKGAVHIDPEDPLGAARVIVNRLESDEESIRKWGKKNAEQFSGHTMVKKYERVYESLLS